MSALLERMHARHAQSPLHFTAKDKALVLSATPRPVLLLDKTVKLITQSFSKVAIPNFLVLKTLIQTSKMSLTGKQLLGYFRPGHPALTAEESSLKVLAQLINRGELIAYQWPHALPLVKKSNRNASWRSLPPYEGPRQYTLAELEERGKTNEELDDDQGIVVAAPIKEELHQVDLEYTYPDGSGVKAKPYVLSVNGAVVAEGTLDSKGSAHISGVPPGNAEVEYKDNVDSEVIATRVALQQALDAALTAEIAANQKEQAAFDAKPVVEQTAELAISAATGLGESYFSAYEANQALTYNIPLAILVLRERIHLKLRGLYQQVVDGATPAGSFTREAGAQLQQAEASDPIDTALAEQLGILDFLNPVVHEQAADAYEMANFLIDDAPTREMLADFAKRYAASQSTSDWAYIGGGAAFQMAYAILMGKVVGASAPLKKLVDLLKKQKTNTANAGATNGVLVNQARHPAPIDLTLNTKGKSGDHHTHQVGETKTQQTTQNSQDTDTAGEPISLITGEELLTLTDLTVDGPLPLQWTRTYRTSNPDDTGLGHGWTHSLSDYLVIDTENQQLHLHDAEGRTILLPLPTQIGERTHNTAEQLTALLLKTNTYLITPYGQPQGIQRHFSVLDPNGPERSALLTRVQDHYHNGYHLHYTDSHLARITGTQGDVLHLHYSDCGHHIARLVHQDTYGNDITQFDYRYNADNDLVSSIDAEGYCEHYQYDNHIISQRQLKSGYRFYFEWDQLTPHAKCLRQWGDPINGQPTYDYRFEWDTDNRQVAVTDTRGGQQVWRYNEQAKLIYHQDAEGSETLYEYNEQGLRTGILRPNGDIEAIFYNDRGQPDQVVNALGQHTWLDYDDDGRPIATINEDGQCWRRQYNSHNQVSAIINPLGQATRYTYNKLGLIGSITNPLGDTTRYLWNERGQLTAIRDAMGRNQHYRYNTKHQLEAIQHAPQQVTRYRYNQQGQISAVVQSDDQTTTYTYTALGLLESVTDPAGRKTTYGYDGLSQVTERINPDGSRLHYEYDGERNLTGLTNEKGERYQLAYDHNERLIQETGFDGKITNYAYNALGHLIQQREQASLDNEQVLVTDYERDALGRLLSQRNQDGGTTFAYNLQGQLTEANNQHRSLRWCYDPAGQLIEDWQYQQKISHAYDAAGNRIATTLPNGDTVKLNYNRAKQFTAMRHIAAGADNTIGQTIAHIRHDEQGREIRRDHGNRLLTVKDYDPQGRLTHQSLAKHTATLQNSLHNHLAGRASNNYQPLNDKRYHYNNAGQLTQIDDSYKGTTAYTYDALDRLTQVDGPVPETILHDPAHNILAIHQGEHKSEPEKAVSPQIERNRLKFQGDRHFTYDAFGNRIQQKRGKGKQHQTDYYYNAQHQLVSVKNSKGDTTFAYDALGRRVSKIHTNKAGETTKTTYLWQGDNLLEDVKETNGKKESQVYLFEPHTHKPLALIKDKHIYRYLLDHLGTAEALTNDQGQVVWYGTYSSYGNLALDYREETLAQYQHYQGEDAELPALWQPFRFQGQVWDEETGLHYNRHRYYDPQVGSFLTQDPIKLLGGINNYQYVPNPISWIDPLGLSCKEAQLAGPPLYGPFHRKGDSPENIQSIMSSGDYYGNPATNYRASPWSTAQAFTGPLPEGVNGFEFYTGVKPRSGTAPWEAQWVGDSGGVHTTPGVKVNEAGQAVIPLVKIKPSP